jgi:hypothetical protein
VHENHFFIVIPLIALAATLRREFRPVLLILSLAFAANLYLFYGFDGSGAPAVARTFTAIDSTVLVAVAACAAFVWYAIVLHRTCASTLVVSGAVSR